MSGPGIRFPILLVEDDANDSLLLQVAFRKANIHGPFHAVPNVEQAICYLSGSGRYADRSQFPFPSVLLLDLKLPGASGLEVLEWLQRSGIRPPNLSIIVLTSSRHSEDIERAYAMGADSYMVKPNSTFDELAAMIRSLDGLSQ